METIIVNPYTTETKGVVECTGSRNNLIVVYSFTSNENKKVMRLRALSSKKPFNAPLRIDVPVFEKGKAFGRREISSTDAGLAGYMLKDIDTFVLTYESKDVVEVAAVGFGGLSWDISYSISRICEKTAENPLYKSEKLLEKLKGNKGNQMYKIKVIDAISAAMEKLKPADVCPHEGYQWFRFTSRIYPLDMSIFVHLTQKLDYQQTENNPLLFGAGDLGHTAVAIKAKGKNPFVNVMDCAVCKGEYWIVGICFKDDGQYFERI